MASLADRAQPLIRDRGWRGLIAFGIAVSGCLVGLVGCVVLLLLEARSGYGVAFGILSTVCGVLAAWAVEVGAWRRGVIGYAQRVAVALGVLAAVTVCVAGIARGARLLLELPTYGTAPSAATPSFAAAAVGALAAALLSAAAPLAGKPAALSRSRLRRTAVGVTIVGGLAVVSAAATAAAPAGCGVFDFQAERWRSELGEGGGRLVRMGEAVRRCGIVEEGMTRPQVRALLGRPSSAFPGTFMWAFGDDGGLLSVQGSLIVSFERRDGIDRVSDVTLESD